MTSSWGSYIYADMLNWKGLNHCEWNIFINKNTSNFFLIDISKSQGQKICIIDQACSIKMVDIGQVLFSDFMDRDAKIARADIQPPKKEYALSITDLLNSKIFRLESRITSLKITMFRRKTLVFIGEKW